MRGRRPLFGGKGDAVVDSPSQVSSVRESWESGATGDYGGYGITKTPSEVTVVDDEQGSVSEGADGASDHQNLVSRLLGITSVHSPSKSLRHSPSKSHSPSRSSVSRVSVGSMDALQSLRRELVLLEEGRRSVEASEERWRREAERSVVLAEDMRQLVVSKDKALDDAGFQVDLLKQDIGKLKADLKRVGKESVAAQIRAGRAEMRLEELKEASRGAIKRNDSLLAHLESCRVSMEELSRDRKERGIQAKKLESEMLRADQAERDTSALRKDVGVLSEALAKSEAARYELQVELDKDRKSRIVREAKYQEAVVAHCTLANELRERVLKLEEEAKAQRGRNSWEEVQRLRERVRVLEEEADARDAWADEEEFEELREKVRLLEEEAQVRGDEGGGGGEQLVAMLRKRIRDLEKAADSLHEWPHEEGYRDFDDGGRRRGGRGGEAEVEKLRARVQELEEAAAAREAWADEEEFEELREKVRMLEEEAEVRGGGREEEVDELRQRVQELEDELQSRHVGGTKCLLSPVHEEGVVELREGRIAQLEAELEESRHDLAVLREMVRSFQEQDSSHDLVELRDTIQHLQQQLDARDRNDQALVAELRQKNASLAAAATKRRGESDDEIRELRSKLRKLESDAKDEAKGYQDEIRELRGRVYKLSSERTQEDQREIQELRAKVGKLETEASKRSHVDEEEMRMLHEKVQKLQSETSKHSKDNQDDEVRELRSMICKLESGARDAADDHSCKVRELQAKVSVLEAELKEKPGEAEELEMMRKKCRNLEQQLAASKEALELCQEELISVQEEFDQLIDVVNMNVGKGEGKSQKEIESLREELEEARGACGEAERDRDRAELKMERAEQRLAQERKEHERSRQRLAELQGRLPQGGSDEAGRESAQRGEWMDGIVGHVHEDHVVEIVMPTVPTISFD